MSHIYNEVKQKENGILPRAVKEIVKKKNGIVSMLEILLTCCQHFAMIDVSKYSANMRM